MSNINKPQATPTQNENTEAKEQQKAQESVKEETRNALGSLNFDVFAWLSKNISEIGSKFSQTISSFLDGLGSKFQNILPSWGQKEAKKSDENTPLESKDILAETGSFLKRLPLDPGDIKRKLDPKSFDKPRGRSRKHNSIDIAVPAGKPVYAGFDAKVTNIVPVATGTNSILYLQDGSGNIVVKYIHLSRIDVKIGQSVSANTVVGLSGGAKGQPGAGTSTGPHLHMEVIHKGAHVNPYAHLAGCNDCPSTLKSA